METFLPTQFHGQRPQNCVQLGDSPIAINRPGTALKRLERLQTKAVFYAGLAATGCGTAYELEQRFSPNTPNAGEAIGLWSVGRDRLWDRWQRGTSTVAHMCRKKKPALFQRLAAVRAVSPRVDHLLAMRLWRCLDPVPLTPIDLEPPTSAISRFMGERTFGPMGPPNSPSPLATHLLAGLASPTARYDAMCGLWLRLRASCAIHALGCYALYYLCWLRARQSIETDAVFGPIAAELYDYTGEQFSSLALNSQTQAAFEAAVSSLKAFDLEPQLFAEQLLAKVDPQELDLLFARAEQRWRNLRNGGQFGFDVVPLVRLVRAVSEPQAHSHR